MWCYTAIPKRSYVNGHRHWSWTGRSEHRFLGYIHICGGERVVSLDEFFLVAVRSLKLSYTSQSDVVSEQVEARLDRAE